MSQIFELRLAPETLPNAAQLLGVTTAQLQHIKVKVSATITQRPEAQLWLTYHIQLPYADLAAQLNWSAWESSHVNFTDYLWEQTCLECFIGGSASNHHKSEKNDVSTGYIEINASPNGNYALYQFDSYRHPSILPPTPLLTADGNSCTHINWPADLSELQSKLQEKNTTTLSPAPKLTILAADLIAATFTVRYCYQRSFGLSLTQLPTHLFDNSCSNNTGIEQLHPCVILWFGEVALYFSSAHASPPDFHQRSYWPRFNYQAAFNEQAKLK